MQTKVYGRNLTRVSLASAAAVVVGAATPDAAAALRALVATQWLTASTDIGWASALAVLVAWVAGAWLAAMLATSVVAALPGRVGRCGRRLALRITPRALRGALGLSIAVTTAATPLVGGSAIASPAPVVTAVAEAGIPIELPATAAPEEVPALDWPVIDAPAASPSGAPAAAPLSPGQRSVGPTAAPAAASVHVVRPGDCLWSIAAAALPSSAGRAVIAAAWPRWYAANAAAIGPDPDLLRPGLQLSAPVPARSTGSR